LAGTLAYVNSFNVPFHYDDFYFLKENLNIKSFSIFWNWLTGDHSRVFTGRPFLLFTFFLNYKLGGLDTFGYHLLNLLIHATNAFLLYFLFFRYAETDKEKSYSLKYLIAAVLFLIHPINTESVTYISSRSSVLSGFFVLMSMLCFFRATEERLHLGFYISSVLFFILGLSTKETSIVIFPLLILFDYFFVSKNFKNLSSRLKYYFPYILLIGLLSTIYIRYITMPMPEAARPWLTHMFTELKVFTEYLKLLFIPVGLNIDHDIKPSHFIDGYVAFSLALALALISMAIFLKKKQRVISFSILWVFINMAPFLAIRLNDFMAERWVYIASIGFSIGISEILTLLTNYYRRAGIAITAVIIILFGTLTVMRNQVYASQVTLWEDAARKSQNKYRPYLNLSRAYKESGNLPLAIENAKKTIEKTGANSIVVEAYINLSAAYDDMGAYKEAENALKPIEKYATDSYAYYHNLGSIYIKMQEYEKALAAFKKALTLHPASPLILYSIGLCYENFSQNEKAKEYFMLATQKIPQNAQEYTGQGISFFKLGNGKKALESFYEAVKADPLDVNVRIYLADILLGNGYYDTAFKQYLMASKISSSYAPAYKGMGKAMLAKGDLKEARGHFKKALSLLPSGSPERKELLELANKTK